MSISEVQPLEIGDLEDAEAFDLILNVNGRESSPIISEQNVTKISRTSALCTSFLIFSIAVGFISFQKERKTIYQPSQYIPSALLSSHTYNANDFQNEVGNIPPYWKDASNHQLNNTNEEIPHLGPCYLPETEPNWKALIKKNRFIKSAKNIKYEEGYNDNKKSDETNLAGLCRPGFIIIGAGKCGTSSLYHYLVDHPRILPAKNKQIHYFKYFTKRPMHWYLKNFPPAETFLSNGALMTGEASPGYLPYPDVAHRLTSWMQTKAGNGEGQAPVTPKVITIVRNPLERSWSSYKYNYKQPLIERLRKDDTKKHTKHSDEWFNENSIFSFEDLIAAELKVLKDCLKPSGKAEKVANSTYGSKFWAIEEISRRETSGLPPMIAIDESCYGGRVSSSVPRYQWTELAEKYPKKKINVPNLHLVQSLVGRSLYTLPLEWWYAVYPKDSLYLVCSEDLRYRTSETMTNLTEFLGLPAFDFTNATSVMFNIGDRPGYDKATESNSIQPPEKIPISDGLKKDYMNFVAYYNQRLFELVGKSCHW